MSESLDGVRVAATRQNSGTALYAAARPPAAGVNSPAGTIRAWVTFASGSVSVARLSQDAACAGAARAQTAAAQSIGLNSTGDLQRDPLYASTGRDIIS